MKTPFFGHELRRVRKGCCLTQAELAECVGVSQGNISRWETGFNFPSLEHLMFLNAALGTGQIYSRLYTALALDLDLEWKRGVK